MDWILWRVTVLGRRRVTSGGHWLWAVLAASAFVLRRARRQGEGPTVPLRRGETLMISTFDEPRSPA